MLDFTTKLGQRAKQRMETEGVIWLTTVDATGTPQPRPVWFIWDGEAFVIYSQVKAKKVQHIRQNPHVSLHFDSGENGEDIQVFLGEARLVENPTPAHENMPYMDKYRKGIQGLGFTEKAFSSEYIVKIRVVPSRLRSF